VSQVGTPDFRQNLLRFRRERLSLLFDGLFRPSVMTHRCLNLAAVDSIHEAFSGEAPSGQELVICAIQRGYALPIFSKEGVCVRASYGVHHDRDRVRCVGGVDRIFRLS
jgi:hypothetical protein